MRMPLMQEMQNYTRSDRILSSEEIAKQAHGLQNNINRKSDAIDK